MKEQLKIYSAALLGVASPAANRFLEITEPIMRVLLLAVQIGVATATIIYIWGKIKNLRKKK